MPMLLTAVARMHPWEVQRGCWEEAAAPVAKGVFERASEEVTRRRILRLPVLLGVDKEGSNREQQPQYSQPQAVLRRDSTEAGSTMGDGGGGDTKNAVVQYWASSSCVDGAWLPQGPRGVGKENHKPTKAVVVVVVVPHVLL